MAAIGIIVALVIGAAGGYLAKGGSSSTGSSSTAATMTETTTITTSLATSAAAAGLSGTITLGALIPQTGAIPTGTHVTTAINMAITAINNQLKAEGITQYQFAVKEEDTQTNPAVDLTELQTLASQGIKVFLGPMSSAETSNILSYANSNHLVLLETGTAATVASLPASSYRFIIVPNDDTETTALASMVYQKGFSCAVTIWRDDSWGVPFSSSFDQQYVSLGGKVLDNLTYAPSTSGTVDFTSQLTQMNTDFTNGQSSCGAGKVAVVGMEFAEMAATLSQSQGYPALKAAQWFTDDTEINDPSFTPSVGQLAANVKIQGVNWAVTSSPATLAFDAAYNATVGSEPSSYTTAMYDGVFLAAEAIMTAGVYDGAAVHATIGPVSQTFFGVSGYMGMTANGDRGPTDYQVFEVNPSGSNYAWQTVGVWSFASHQISYNSNYRA